MSYWIDYSQCTCGGYTNIDHDSNSEVMHYDNFIKTFDCVPSPKWRNKTFRVWTCFHCWDYLKHDYL